ncbi:MAG: single-stranded-DNA-specific exonuclease RecJ [Coriobacteriia bacterium]|nr:single-stranded-DNA-specific exonuclease RecJ [Coriobacteriia bacterium]
MSIRSDRTPWILAPVDEAVVTSLADGVGLSRVTARVLAVRGVTGLEDARRFMEPSLEGDWLDPALIPGMDEASERVARAVEGGERIVVFGDFDLDGISAAAVLARGLRELGAECEAVVPHRFGEGYGLSEGAIERAVACDPSLLVTVDTGVSSSHEVEMLRARGIDVVVTDHHEPSDSVPSGVPVANPKLRADCPSRDLSGSGVALKLVHAVGARLGRPDVWRGLVDLAMLGTVADIVPLSGENRALVREGVRAVAAKPRVALAALCAVGGVSCAALTAGTVAYSLAPRLNAAGRMADPTVALDLLLTDDPVRAETLANALDEHNRIRQSVEADLYEAASALAERTYRGERGLVLAGEGWHEGVKGIVASRLAGQYGVPTILFAIEDGVAKGSGRSVGRVDLFRAIEACASLTERFGGHAAAAGLTVGEANLDAFREAFVAHLDALPPELFEVSVSIDAEVALDEVSIELGAELSLLEPFGQANRRPVLLASGVFMNGRDRVGRGAAHLKFTAFDGVASVPAIAFRCRDVDSYCVEEGPVDLAFELDVDEWRGRRRVQLIVRDIRPSASARREEPAADLVADLFARADELLAREEYAGIEEAPSFHTKLAGVTFEGRQEVLERLSAAAPLRLVRQPDNPHDANACALLDSHGDQVGFFNRRLAGVLAPAIDRGVEYDVEVSEVTGGDAGRSRGVNVLVTRRDAALIDVEREEDRAAARAALAVLDPDALNNELVARFIGDRQLHDAQAEALRLLAEGRSTLVVMATGRGKSLIFHLHAARTALASGRASVFVYPLRALVADQAYHLTEAFAEVGLSVKVVTGETSATDRSESFSALADGSLDVVLTTPEFLHFHSARFAESGRIGFVVVDEAHHVGLSRAGNRPAYARLGDAIASLGSPTVLAVTATASDDVAAQIRSTLGITHVVLDPTVRDNLLIADQRGVVDRDAELLKIVQAGDKAVVYVNSRDASVRLARLVRKGVPGLAWKTAFYNGGLSRSVRHAVERAFRTGEVRLVVATSAFGEGVNIPDIRNVVLYHLPFNDVEFNQMAGRGGRDGATARVHLLFGEKDARINELILSTLAPPRDDLATLYRVLRQTAGREGVGFEITNAELAEACGRAARECRLDDRGVSSALGVFRELGLVTGEGHGAYRRLTLVEPAAKVDLAASVRYTEGLDEIAGFAEFREWALAAGAPELLARFNRPILPTAT